MPFCIMSVLSMNRNFTRLLNSSPKTKIICELSFCITAITAGLPLAVAIFPPISQKEGPLCEEKFHKFEKLYFSKGL
jgi:thermostable 8-oxoguanine DNA glycosylase